MSLLTRVLKTVGIVLYDNLEDLAMDIIVPWAVGRIKYNLGTSATKWLFARAVSNKAIDGAILGGVNLYNNTGWKAAIRKGLPLEGERRLAIENEPHALDGFSGVIKSGYGKGTKKMVFKGQAILKVKGKTSVTDIEYHEHQADRAGLHYDLAIRGLPVASDLFELNIGRGPVKGRYSFVPTERGYLVSRMKDRGIVLPKPTYNLKDEAFLRQLDKDDKSKDYIIDRKYDGSLGIVLIRENRAIIHSHREVSNTYYDKLPSLEFLQNKSPFLLSRKLFPGPDLEKTVLKVELVHKDGVSIVSGILNSSPDNAQLVQEKVGNVEAFIWDILNYRGKDTSRLPYEERRRLVEDVGERIRLFNQSWHTVERFSANHKAFDFYHSVINDPRGLPYSEGVVIKDKTGIAEDSWYKVKRHDLTDMEIISFEPATMGSRIEGKLGAIVARDLKTGKIATVGSGFSDYERDFIWQNRDLLTGAVIKVKVFQETEKSFRAPRYIEIHPDKGNNEAGLLMYADVLSGINGRKDMLATKFKLINR
jgi:ATP dependent DNA ligase-like protein